MSVMDRGVWLKRSFAHKRNARVSWSPTIRKFFALALPGKTRSARVALFSVPSPNGPAALPGGRAICSGLLQTSHLSYTRAETRRPLLGAFFGRRASGAAQFQSSLGRLFPHSAPSPIVRDAGYLAFRTPLSQQ